METLIAKNTQSEQLASEIERKIRVGELSPGFRMPSCRELGRVYGVSLQVVKSAIDKLEGKGLVLSEPRVGLYVNPKALSPVRRNLSILQIRSVGADYAEQLLSLGSNGLWDGYCVSRRQLAPGSESTPELAFEIEKIANVRPDCLLVFLSALDSKSLSLFSKLPFPVIFMGDFRNPELNGVVPNQIVEDTGERAKAFVDYAFSKGLKRLAAMAHGAPSSSSYLKDWHDAAASRAKELGASFRYSSFRDQDCHNDESLFRRNRFAAIDAILSEGPIDALLIESVARTDTLVDAFAARGLRVPEDVKIASSFELHPGAVYVKYDYSAFGRKVQELIDGLVADPSRKLGRLKLSGLIARSFLSVS